MSAPVILICDDDDDDVFFLKKALLECNPGLRVLAVADGEEGIDYFCGRGKFADRAAYPLPDHAFLDIKMPRRSGIEVLRWLRGQPRIGQIPVTVLSGSAIPEDISSAHALAADYITKPVEYAVLLEVAERFCRALSRSASPDP